ncbi:Oidioi.mRNA.OKI2018_I69.chr1.g1755.t1.cds [Oikopleura dioica]|uniref:Oidioi.mRNA.OKI2018_I69.chr1.g1755.t1.cds n=1 Tax=Oikopleura dioica TaxID=34765 RepID=A0ABN7SV73_OIKDI|nr:Oidioi.mRNA.OKI2018_I69.chr1.g1755.t1.cds [Oikopleura dioica]
MQDDAGGLEAMSKDEWFSIPPIKDTFVVNFGNLLEHLTYGVIPATFHQTLTWLSIYLLKDTKMDEKLTRLEEFKWNAHELSEIKRKKEEKGKIFDASEDETFREFFDRVGLRPKFSEDDGKMFYHVWVMIERDGPYDD